MAVLTVGDDLPQYDFQAVVDGVLADLPVNRREDYFCRISSANIKKDQWRLVVIWSKGFAFVCPTELVGIVEIYDELEKRNCEVVAVNTGSEYVYLAWRSKDELLCSIPFPLATDSKHDFLKTVGVLNVEGVCDRVSFLVDLNNKIQFVCVDADSVGRSAKELLRQLDALQPGGLTSCGWRPGEPTLDAFRAAVNLVSLNLWRVFLALPMGMVN